MNSRIQLAEALQFNPKWSDSDRLVIREQCERLDVVIFETIPSNVYLKGYSRTRKEVLRLWPGTIGFRPGFGPRHGIAWEGSFDGWKGLQLTTFYPRKGAA